MIEKDNLKAEFEGFYHQRAERAIAAFQRKRLHAEYVPDCQAALARLLEIIPPDASIGRGDSETLNQIGIMPALRKSSQHRIFDPYLTDEQGQYPVKGEARVELQRQAMMTDVFLSGANALTMDGKVVCTDGNGNRVAALIFGPKKVIIVAGANKLVANLDEAFRRIHEIAAPLNSRRHVMKHHAPDISLETPCAITGSCVDCTSPGRPCCYTVIIEAGRSAESGARAGYSMAHLERIHIVIVGETLGF